MRKRVLKKKRKNSTPVENSGEDSVHPGDVIDPEPSSDAKYPELTEQRCSICKRKFTSRMYAMCPLCREKAFLSLVKVGLPFFEMLTRIGTSECRKKKKGSDETFK